MKLNLNIQTKYILSISMLIVFTAMLLTGFFISEQSNIYNANLGKKANDLVKNIAYNSQLFIENNNQASQSQLLKSVLREDDVIYSGIIDNSSHKKFVSFEADKKFSNKNLIPSQLLRIINEEEFAVTGVINNKYVLPKALLPQNYPHEFKVIAVITPIYMNNEGLDLVKPNAHDIIGYAIVGVSLEKVDQAMRRSIQVSFFITLAVIFMGILALILFNNRLIIYPLRKLLMGTQRIGEGDYNYRIDLNLSDELGMLATSFNQMTEKIKITQDQLAEYNRMLEEKVAERTKELSQALDKLTEADRIKSEFVTNLSHELRTPLNAVIGFSDIILQKIDGEINESQKKDLTLINNSGKHLLSLIDDLLDIAKIETGHAMVNYEQFQISTLAEQVISLTKQGLLDKDIKLKLEIAKDIPIIRADKFKIKRALLNLLSNAVKFTEKGHVALIVSYKEDKFIFEIQDTGIGIKEEDLNKIFERFRQLDSSTTRPHGGIGMGISLVTELIKMHKGDIWVNSVYGKGTSFFFTLPG